MPPLPAPAGAPTGELVARDGIEPPTRRSSVRCSPAKVPSFTNSPTSTRDPAREG